MKTTIRLTASLIFLLQLATLHSQGQCSCDKSLSLLNEISMGYSKSGLVLNEGLGVLFRKSGFGLTAGISILNERREIAKSAPSSQASPIS